MHLVLEAEVSSAESQEAKLDVKWGERGQTEKGQDELELVSVSRSRIMQMLQHIKDDELTLGSKILILKFSVQMEISR